MILLLMRHGIAAEREFWKRDDALRPLTEIGKQKTREAARGLSTRVARVDLIASSPLLRASQTAEIARDFYNEAKMETWDELENAEYSALCARLCKVPDDATALLIGHEPGLSTFASSLIGGTNSLPRAWKKAGVCALEFDYAFDCPYATLKWYATPKTLRALAANNPEK